MSRTFLGMIIGGAVIAPISAGVAVALAADDQKRAAPTAAGVRPSPQATAQPDRQSGSPDTSPSSRTPSGDALKPGTVLKGDTGGTYTIKTVALARRWRGTAPLLSGETAPAGKKFLIIQFTATNTTGEPITPMMHINAIGGTDGKTYTADFGSVQTGNGPVDPGSSETVAHRWKIGRQVTPATVDRGYLGPPLTLPRIPVKPVWSVDNA